MNIVSTEENFILLDINDEQQSNGLNLLLSNIHTFPRKLEPSKYKKFELRLYGIEDKENLKSELKRFVNDYIDIESSDENYLDFWSDQYQIGEFKIESYKEIVTELEKEDWIRNYQSLLDLYYKEIDKISKESILQTKFLDKLKNLNEEELKKYKRKSVFFKDDIDKLESLNSRLSLVKRIENIRQRFISELKNI